MIDQIRWIQIAYANRPLIWVELLFAGVFAGAILLMSQANPSYLRPDEWSIPTGAHPIGWRGSKPNVPNDLASVDDVSLSAYRRYLEGADPNRLDPNQNPWLLKSFLLLRNLPSVKTLRVHQDPILREEFVEIARTKSLEWIDLEGSYLHPADLALLAELPNLRGLLLGRTKTKFDRLPTVVAEIPTLEVLELPVSVGVDDEILGKLARLPKLTRLSFNVDPLDVPGSGLTRAGLRQLAHHSSPSLTLLVSGEKSHDWPFIRGLRGEFAGDRLQVLPAEIDSMRSLRALFIVFAVYLTLVFLGWTLVSQLSSSWAHLAPHYRSRHGIVAIAFISLFAFVGVLCLRPYVDRGWEQVSLVGIAIAAGLLVPTNQSRVDRQKGLAWYFNQIASFVLEPLLALGPYLVLTFAQRESSEFLHGERPAYTVAILLASISFAAVTVIRLRRAAQDIAETSSEAGTLPMLGWTGARGRLGGDKPWSFHPLSRRREQELESLTPYRAELSLSARIRHHLLANPPSLMMPLLILCLPIIVVGRWNLFLKESFLPTRELIATMLVAYAFVFGVVQLIQNWRERLASASVDLLRPITRLQLQNDFTVAFLAHAVTAAIPLSFAIGLSQSREEGILAFFGWTLLALLVVAPLVVSVAGVAILIQSQILFGFIFAGLVVMISFFGAFTLFTAENSKLIWLFLVPGMALGLIGCDSLRRRWSEYEFGLRQ